MKLGIEQEMSFIDKQVYQLEKNIKKIITTSEVNFEDKWNIFCNFCNKYNKGIKSIELDKRLETYIFEKCYSHGFLVKMDIILEEFLEDEVYVFDEKEDDEIRLDKDTKEVIIRTTKELCMNNFAYSYENEVY